MVSNNRAAFMALLADHGLTQAQAAYLICEYTRRPCAVRTVRSWVNDPDKPSSRSCPGWAVEALAEALKRNRIEIIHEGSSNEYQANMSATPETHHHP